MWRTERRQVPEQNYKSSALVAEPGTDAVQTASEQLRLSGISVTGKELLAPHTTYRLGGPADLWVEPRSVDDIRNAIQLLSGCGVPFTVIGGGSNLLVADEGYRGAIISLGKSFRHTYVDGSVMTVGASCSLASVVAEAQRRGLGGIEFAAGIPGTTGGAVAMNAGTRERWMGSVVRTVTYVPVVEGDGGEPPVAGDVVTVDAADLEWGYRTTDLRDRAVVVEVSLGLEESSSESIGETIRAAADRRRTSQPVGTRNAGSVFRNPEGDSAGRLIELAGLKGRAVGGASVSEVHANFIVARDGATAADVHALIVEVQREVVDRFGVKLTPEIRFIGRL